MAIYSSKFIYPLKKLSLFLTACQTVLLFAGCGSEFGILLEKYRYLPLVFSGSASSTVYWSEQTGSIKKISSAGTDERILITASGTPLDIALFVPGKKIYWAEDTGAAFRINYANLDGTGSTIFLNDSTDLPDHGPTDIAIDSGAGMIFWNRYTNASTHNNIVRSSLSVLSEVNWATDSGDITENYTFSIALDTVNRKIFFSANTYWNISSVYGSGLDGSMYGAELDTANTDTWKFSAAGTSNPSMPLRGIAVDGPGGHVFYTSNTLTGLSIIIRSDILLQNNTVWITSQGFDIQKLDLDLRERKIYWTSLGNASIYRANIDQPESGVEQFRQLSAAPTGIAVSH